MNRLFLVSLYILLIIVSMVTLSGVALAQTPAALWTFDEGSGSTANDTSGTVPPNTGTLQGAAGWATGYIGPYCLSLNGSSGSYVDVPGPVVNTASSYTVMCWVYLNSASGYQTFMSMDGSNVSAFYFQLRGDTGKFALTTYASDSTGAAFAEASSTGSPQAGVWYSLAGVYNAPAKTISFYLNGVLQQTTSVTTTFQASGHTAIGRSLYGGSHVDWNNADIDDARIYASALTSAQINAIVGPNLPAPSITLNAGTPGITVSPILYGMMTEEINYSYDGGIYGELIRNRAFKNNSTNPPNDWSLVTTGTPTGSMGLDFVHPLTYATTTSCKLTVAAADASDTIGISNDGYWGIPVKPSTTYSGSFYAMATPGFSGPLTADIESTDGSIVYASAQISGITTSWNKYSYTLTTGTVTATSNARFVIRASSPGTIWFTMVSLFPPTYHGTPNGQRQDLMQLMAGLNPSFLRLPGGNYLEGNDFQDRFEWLYTIHDNTLRPGHESPWGYRSTDGMGLLEYLEWCQNLNCQTVLAVFAGFHLNGSSSPITGTALKPFVQDALDEIQYATGAVTTPWGAQRAADGHPAPFTINYVEVGNEDFFDSSGSYSGANGRFAMFYNAIKAAYPSMQIIATTGVSGVTPDVYDDHFYVSAATNQGRFNYWNGQSRTGPKIFVGEWASQTGIPTTNLNDALGDAIWLMGIEHNSDVCIMESYAPMMVNVNSYQWNYNMIGYNALTSYGSPSYYVQSMFGQNHGNVVIPAVTNNGQVTSEGTMSTTTGTTYLKVVNTSSSSQTYQIVTMGGTAPVSGTAIVLSSTSSSDTNTISAPTNITPQTSVLSGVSSSFSYTFVPYSVTELILSTTAPGAVSPGSVVSGTVSLQGALSPAVPVTFTLSPVGKTRGGAFTRIITPSSTGSFVLNNVPPGFYRLGVKASAWLRKDVLIDARNAKVSGLSFSLLGGDINGDNVVDQSDLILLKQRLPKLPGKIGIKAPSLLGQSQQAQADMAILQSNIGKHGDP